MINFALLSQSYLIYFSRCQHLKCSWSSYSEIIVEPEVVYDQLRWWYAGYYNLENRVLQAHSAYRCCCVSFWCPGKKYSKILKTAAFPVSAPDAYLLALYIKISVSKFTITAWTGETLI